MTPFERLALLEMTLKRVLIEFDRWHYEDKVKWERKLTALEQLAESMKLHSSAE